MKPAIYKFSLRKIVKNVGYAFNGLGHVIRYEQNARIHLLFIALVTSAGFYFRISRNEWLVVLLNIGLVLGLEIINTAIERIADLVRTDENDSMIGIIKDVSAGAVLVAAIVAAVCGCIIFLPKIVSLIQ